MLFFQQFVLRVDPWPAEFTHCLEMYSKDPTVYHTMYVNSILDRIAVTTHLQRLGLEPLNSTSQVH